MESPRCGGATTNDAHKAAFDTVQRIKRKLTQDVVENQRAQKKYIAEGMAKELLILNISDNKGDDDDNAPSSKYRHSRASYASNPFLDDNPTSSPTLNRLRRRQVEESKKENDANNGNNNGSSGFNDVLNFTLPSDVVEYLSRPNFQTLMPRIAPPDNSKALILYTPPQSVVPLPSSTLATIQEPKTMEVDENASTTSVREFDDEEDVETMYF